MANIKENFIAFSSDRIYNQHVSEVTPDSLAFVFKKGQEKLITQGNTFYFIPGNGSVGQVLKKRDGYFSWDDLYSVRVSNSVENLSSEYTYYILEMSNTKGEDSGTTINFGEFVKGQTCTIYMYRSDYSAYAPLILIDQNKYISLNGQYEIKLENVGEWVSAKFFSTGGNVYVEISDLGKETKELGNLIEMSYLMKNGMENSTTKTANAVMANDTDVTKNQYEFAVGKYNIGTRETSSEFGAKNSLFTVGNGLNASNRHDAFQVLQNGEIMIPDLDSEGDYYKKGLISLQSKLKEYETAITDLKKQVELLSEKLDQCCSDTPTEEETPEDEETVE